MIEYVEHPLYGSIRVSRRKGSRTIRIGLSQDGEIRLSLPYRVSLQQGLAFIEQKKHWIEANRKDTNEIDHGARIGKYHSLHISTVSSDQKTAIKDNVIYVRVTEDASAEDVQKKITAAAKRALKKESEALLPKQLKSYATAYGYSYKSVTVKPLKSRWGSCSSNNDIILNIYLMQLPWKLIDYVILHELAHTKHHNHSTAFWEQLRTTIPDADARKKELKKYPTSIFDARLSEEYMS